MTVRDYTKKINVGNSSLYNFGAATLASCANALQPWKNNGYFMVFLPNPGTNPSNYQNVSGQCYMTTGTDVKTYPASQTGDGELYKIPTDCGIISENNVENCLVNSQEAAYNNQVNQLKNDIDAKNNQLLQLKIQKYADKNGMTYDQALTEYQNKQAEIKLANERSQLQEQINLYNKQLAAINNANMSGSNQLSDKNRLLATVNSKIQTTYSRLDEINNQINTITQNIYANNSEVERKDQIVKTMKAIITILFILLLVMIIYYSSSYAEKAFPSVYNSVKNTMSSFGNLKF